MKIKISASLAESMFLVVDKTPATEDAKVKYGNLSNEMAVQVMGWHSRADDPRRLWRTSAGVPVVVDGRELCQFPAIPENQKTDLAFTPMLKNDSSELFRIMILEKLGDKERPSADHKDEEDLGEASSPRPA